jgi:N4-gp56 family major capsid protein
MATFGSGDHIDITNSSGSAAGFVPEIWEDDVVAAYKQNLVISNLVSKINHQGRKGDTIYLPSVTDRNTALPSAKAEDTAVTLVPASTGEITVSLNKHYEYSFLYEDLTSLQALDSLRRHYTDHAGYALARQVDRDIFAAFENMQGGTNFSGTVIGSDGTTAWDGTANTNAGNAAALTDAGIRKIMQTLDDQDNPMSDRALVIPPVERNNIMGLARFTEQAFVGEAGSGNTIRNGVIGQLYGVGVYITTNCPYIHIDSADGDDVFLWTSTAMGTGNVSSITGETVAVGTDGGVVGRVALMLHRDAVVHAEQQSIRTQTQYKQEYLGDLFTADCVYGVSEKRDYAAVAIAVAD